MGLLHFVLKSAEMPITQVFKFIQSVFIQLLIFHLFYKFEKVKLLREYVMKHSADGSLKVDELVEVSWMQTFMLTICT